MIKSNKIEVKFGTPQHGWLSIILIHKEFKLEIDISNAPLDPMVQLCDTLIELSKGIGEPTQVIWNLEPDCYYLQIRKLEVGYKAIILESDELDSPAKVDHSPIYRTAFLQI
jgi:hypothetical protein